MSYQTQLSCFSFACSAQPKELTERLKYSNKILLPPNVLFELNQQNGLETNDPLYFKITNPELDFGQVCGVQEFSAPPGVCHIPYHVMSNIAIEEGNNVKIERVTPVKGTYIKLQPHSTAFIELSDPKAVLERILSRDYPVVTQGHTIAIHHKELKRTFYINIIKTEPADMISIVDTDINVDFDAPLDYVPPEPQRPPTPPPLAPNTLGIKFGENKIISPQNNACCQEKNSPTNEFVPFTGTGNRLGDS